MKFVNRLVVFLFFASLLVYFFGSLALWLTNSSYGIPFMYGIPAVVGLVWLVFGSKPFNRLSSILGEVFK